MPCATGSGIGLAETARGLLLHRVQVERGLVTDYRIVAPTEWNFHPGGPLAQGLNGRSAADARATRARGAHDRAVAGSVRRHAAWRSSMHEMSLAEGIVQIVESTARANDGGAVRAVWLELGALSHVEHEALRFSFDVVKRGTRGRRRPAGGRSRRPGAPGACRAGIRSTSPGSATRARACGSYQLQVTQGEEMRVKEIEIA